MNLLQADALSIPMANESVHLAVLSPPYYCLRDYEATSQLGQEGQVDCLAWARGEPPCSDCYACSMRRVAYELRRVVRSDGLIFVVIGDSYAGSNGNGYKQGMDKVNASTGRGTESMSIRKKAKRVDSHKPKDLMLVPHRIAMALQADGLYLRNEIIWNKPNPRPESVTDRFTKCHEHIFMFSLSREYYFDSEAVKEPVADKSNPAKRNRRDVWSVPVRPYKGTHTATFPPDLVEIMIQAGTSEKGCCSSCGKQLKRVTSRTESEGHKPGNAPRTETIGWQVDCSCQESSVVPSVVLDPFVGSGTTVAVARKLGRTGVGLDMSFSYLRDCAKVRVEVIAEECK